MLHQSVIGAGSSGTTTFSCGLHSSSWTSQHSPLLTPNLASLRRHSRSTPTPRLSAGSFVPLNSSINCFHSGFFSILFYSSTTSMESYDRLDCWGDPCFQFNLKGSSAGQDHVLIIFSLPWHSVRARFLLARPSTNPQLTPCRTTRNPTPFFKNHLASTSGRDVPEFACH